MYPTTIDPKYIEKLFCRGYLITNNKNVPFPTTDLSEYWHTYVFDQYTIFIHKDQHFYYKIENNRTLFLIGNCVNPFSGDYVETDILTDIYSAVDTDLSSAQDKINELTGDFLIGYIANESLSFISDPTQMLFCTYGFFENSLYISSHYQLIADLFKLDKDNYTIELEKYRFFYKYGLFFPGDRTPYQEIKRTLTNHLYRFSNGSMKHERIYPTKDITACQSESEYLELIKKVSDILKSTMVCASKKWKMPSVSLTGGMDSKTTLSATNGLHDKFKFYSYCSMHGDKIDSDAAHIIAEHLGIKHTVFNISENDSDFPDIESHKAVLEHNLGNYKCNDNDIRKRAFFSDQKPFDVEIKSWVSEIGRANYYKKFGLKKMPEKLSPRQMTSMYKIFLTERKLAKKTDLIFEEFIEKSKFNNLPSGYDASDMYLWEFRYSAWGGIVITSEHSYSNEIFIPFNNRLLLDLMLKAPKDKRISDEFHEDLIKFGDPRISELGITITNWNETKLRQKIERLYFLIHSFIKF